MPEREAIKDYELGMQPEEDVDFEFMSPNHLVGPNIGLIPLLNAFQPTRAFYGARFANQAQPLAKPETPWVQTSIDETPDISFDDSLGGIAGAVHAGEDGVVEHVTPQQIHLNTATGKKIIDLHDHTPFNRYSGITQTPVVTKGQTIKAKDLLARSNFTDDKGALALGLNATIGVVPFKGHSMDDAMVVSQSFANRATSQHLDTVDKDFSGGTFRGGQDHYKSLFPNVFTKDQLSTLDEHGVVKPGQTVQPGDPLILATKPRNFNSAQTASLGRLGKVARQQRADASTTWDSKFPGRVTDVVRQKDGSTKVMVESNRPTELGDKMVLRSGQKSIVSKIIPDHEMPRTASGQQLDMLLNQQGIPSRANPSLILELMLGKLAAKQGKPIKLPAFNKEGDNWVQHVRDQLKLAGLTDKETVFDPSENRKLDNPISVGNAYVLKLHHVSEHKVSARGQGSYDSDGQPSKGGDTGAKRRSGLESAAMLSSGAYNNLRESATLTGQQCFDPETEVLTETGWKKWDKVTNADILFTRDPGDATKAWYEKPQRLVSYHFEGQLVGYEGRHLDWLVTPDHKFWGVPCVVSRNKPWYKKRFFEASHIFGKAGSIDAFGAVFAGEIPDSHVIHIPPVSGVRCAGISIPLADYCSLLGWWLAEGSASIDKKDGSGRIVISQTERVNKVNFDEISGLFARLGFNKPVKVRRSATAGKKVSFVTHRPENVGEVVGLKVCHRALAEHLLQFGNRSWVKRVPDILFKVSPAMRLEFLRCFVAGDGCVRSTQGALQDFISTSSPTLRDDLQRLSILSGMASFIGLCKGATYKRPHYRIISSFNVTDLAFVKSPSKTFKGHYKRDFSGMVYCATMRTGMLFVRRNGKCMWSGNCDEFWRSFRSGQPVQAPGQPFVFKKFRALLNGAGLHANDHGNGQLRLGLLTDRLFSKYNPLPVHSGETVDFRTLQPKHGGLFDPALTAGHRWGALDLPEPLPNPAAEATLRTLLGNLTQKDFEAVLAGQKHL